MLSCFGSLLGWVMICLFIGILCCFGLLCWKVDVLFEWGAISGFLGVLPNCLMNRSWENLQATPSRSTAVLGWHLPLIRAMNQRVKWTELWHSGTKWNKHTTFRARRISNFSELSSSIFESSTRLTRTTVSPDKGLQKVKDGHDLDYHGRAVVKSSQPFLSILSIYYIDLCLFSSSHSWAELLTHGWPSG